MKKFTLCVVVFTVSAAQAMYVMPDLEQIPIERLITNLTKVVKDKPKDARAILNLARAHAMAYASKQSTTMVARGRETDGAWFGPGGGKNVPFVVERKADAAARAHLAKAIDLYATAVKLAPDDVVSRLGYGWCLEQAGLREKAIATYREVIKQAWVTEKTVPFSLSDPVTSEAAGYLIPLLDHRKNAAEIAALQEKVDTLERRPRAITPIAIPLFSGSSVAASSIHVPFDADGSGIRKQWTWISSDAGWLVYDRQGLKQISSGLQMFGNVTFWIFWRNGYEALASLDDDHDGKLNGRELDGLAIWRDANSNGISEPGEVASLAEWNIVALSCAYQRQDSDLYAASSPTGATFADGSTRATYDVLLHSLSVPLPIRSMER